MPGSAIAIASTLLGVTALAMLWATRRQRRGTTLVAPAAWSGLSLATLALATVCETLLQPGEKAESWRYLAAVGTFCPVMALLGAKRPQHTAWQWIVGSLWGLLALPALESLVLRPGDALYIAPAWRWLVAILWAIEAMNHVPTRYWPSACLALLGQGVLLRGCWPVEASWLASFGLNTAGLNCTGLALLVASLALVVLGLPRLPAGITGLDRVWIDFRNSFGAAWGLRIIQRLQETSRLRGWGVNATWQGFATNTGEQSLSRETAAHVEQALESLLWRYVSKPWIATRMQRDVVEDLPLASAARGESGEHQPVQQAGSRLPRL